MTTTECVVSLENSSIHEIARKVATGERLTYEEGLRLYLSPDIHTLGRLANLVRERLHGRVAYYNINRHINYSNYCVLRCKFCSFYRPYPKERVQSERVQGSGFRVQDPAPQVSRPAREHSGVQGSGLSVQDGKPLPDGRGSEMLSGLAARSIPLPLAGDAARTLPDGRGSELSTQYSALSTDSGGYELSLDDIVARAKEAYAQGATEVHIVGGLHPRLPFEFYTDMCSAIRAVCPGLHIKAFTAIEIIHFTRIAKPRLSIADVLTRLVEAGLGSLPGGGAEIFDDRVHDEAFKTKVGEAEWFEVHRTAHELGIFSNATMLYGHVETPAERIRHLVKLREHQDESLRSRKAHFNCIIPLSFIPDGSALEHLPGPTGLMDLKTLAISRLMLDNFPHVKAFWIMQTPKLAQVSLNWGVDDIDGTVVYYDITKREGHGTTHQELTVDRLKRLICEAGCTPVERDTLYRPVRCPSSSDL